MSHISVSCRVLRPSAVLILGVLCLGGCATTPQKLSPSATESSSSRVIYDTSAITLVSTLASSSVKVSAFHTAQGDLMMNLELDNLSQAAVDIDPKRIEVLSIRKTGSPRKLKVLSDAEFAQKTKQRLSSGGFVADLLGIATQVGAGLASSAVPAAGEAISLGGHLLSAGIVPKMRSSQSAQYSWASGVYHAYLKPMQLGPGGRYGGTLICEASPTGDYEIRIPVGQETHVLTFQSSGDKLTDVQRAGR